MSNSITYTSPHIHKVTSVNTVMRQVIYALVPGILLSTWVFGWGVLFHCILCITFAMLFEALALKLRHQPLHLYLTDGTAVVTALLFALTISPLSPWWVDLSGIAFAILIAKHLYGGLGQNIFNPAMAGYVLVLLCYPAEVVHWPIPAGTAETRAGITGTFRIIFELDNPDMLVDAISRATPLAYLQSELSGMAMIGEIRAAPQFGIIGGRGWEVIALAWLAGGIWLFIKKIIDWQMPVAFLGTLFLLMLFMHWYDSNIHASPLLHIFTGGTMLAAFFIITDPVSASTTPRGRWIYAAGIAVITCLIRKLGNFPDGIAFAVLIMNAAVPFIDSLTRPKVFGEE